MTASRTSVPIDFIDLAAQRARLGADVDAAILAVLDHGRYIMGPEVEELESRLAEYTGTAHAVSCANGTDALVLTLRGLEIGPGDAVLVPTFTFAATAESVVLAGATPVFCDVLEGTYSLDPASLRAGIDAARAAGLRARAVIPVDLFGQPADYDAIGAVTEAAELVVVADGAQSFGATLSGRKVGSLAHVTTTSFFPAKPLGCYGDGGAIFTDDAELADRLRSLRAHGKGEHKYEHVRVGTNSRLDTIQAAVLLQKLGIFDDELARREKVAEDYRDGLDGIVEVPRLHPDTTSAWAQFTIVPSVDREELAVRLRQLGVPTAVYYPLPLHRQTAYARTPRATRTLDVAERLATRVLSLPMHPYLSSEDVDHIVTAVRRSAG